MSFTPIESTIGGLLIGLSVATHFLFQGHVTGMSGELARLINRQSLFKKRWLLSVLYAIGLLSGGILLQLYFPFAFNQESDIRLPPSLSSFSPETIYFIAGLFVGVGTKYGKGCTSGHMICGIARLSKRSFVATCTFVLTAFVLVQYLGTADVLTLPSQSFVTYPNSTTTFNLLLVLISIFGIYVVLYIIATQSKKQSTKENALLLLFLQFFDGLVFSLGLGISGMTKPQKVLGFFDIFGKSFDPSLMCVAISAIFTNMIWFNKVILPKSKNQSPLVALTFDLPTKTEITSDLVIGGLLFGIGWGLVGICPGPGFVSLVTLKNEIISWACGLYIGFAINEFFLS